MLEGIYYYIKSMISKIDTILNYVYSINDSMPKRPSGIKSKKIVLSGGTAGTTEQLFTSSTPVVGTATIYRDPNDTGNVYVGGEDAQEFPLEPGGVLRLNIKDLSNVYVNVPANVTATIYVIWEV